MSATEKNIKAILEKTINLASKLIKFYPKYESSGLNKAQNYLRDYLETQSWDKIILEPYSTDTLKDNLLYVKVPDFGEIYSNYENFNKYNLIGLIDSQKPGPILILNGHIDVDIVDETVAWKEKEGWRSGIVKDGKLFGRGATDMLSGLSALAEVANYFNNNKHLWRGKIIFKSVMDEEIGGNGTLSSLLSLKNKRWYKAQHIECVIAEPSENQLCNISLGFLHLKFNFIGQPTHMGTAKKENNAVTTAAEFIHIFDNLFDSTLEEIKASHLKDRFKYNFGIINGGIDSAVPIENIELQGTIFYPADISKEAFISCLISNTHKLYNNVSIKESGFSFPGANFTNNIFGYSNQNRNNIFPSPCDARLYKEFGIPTTIFGPGSLDEAHSINEYIEIKFIEEYIELLLKNMLSYFNYENVR